MNHRRAEHAMVSTMSDPQAQYPGLGLRAIRLVLSRPSGEVLRGVDR